jgi:hypothetical protein
MFTSAKTPVLPLLLSCIGVNIFLWSLKTTSTFSKTPARSGFGYKKNFAFVVFNPQRIVTDEDEILSIYDRNISIRLESGFAQDHHLTRDTSATSAVHYFCAGHVHYGSIHLEPVKNSFKLNRENYTQQRLLYLNGTQEHLETLLSSKLIYVPMRNFFGADQILVYCVANDAGLLAASEEEFKQQQKLLLYKQVFINNFFDWYAFLSIIVNPINDLPTILINKTSFVLSDNVSEKYLHELLHGSIQITDDDDDDQSVIGLPYKFPSTYMVNISVSHQKGEYGFVKLPPRKFLGGLTIREDSTSQHNSIALVGPLPRINIALSYLLFIPKQSRLMKLKNMVNKTIGVGTIIIKCWNIPREFRRTKEEFLIPNSTHTTDWATDTQMITFSIIHVNLPPKVTFTCRKHSHTHGVLQTREDEPFFFCQNRGTPCLLELDDIDSNSREEVLSLNMTVVVPTATSKVCVVKFQMINDDHISNLSQTSCTVLIQGTLTYLRGIIENIKISFIPHWYGHSRLYVSLSDSHGATDRDDILFLVLPVNDPPSLDATSTNITVKHNIPTLLSTLTRITAHDPDAIVFTTSSRNSRRPPTFTATIDTIGGCGYIRFRNKVAGSYIVSNQNYENIENYLGPYSTVVFRGTINVINEVVSTLLYLSSCPSNQELISHQPPLQGEISILLVDEGYFGKAGEGIGTVGGNVTLLKTSLSILVNSIVDESVSLNPSVYSHYNDTFSGMSTSEFLGISDSWENNDVEENTRNLKLSNANTEGSINLTDVDIVNNKVVKSTLNESENEDFSALIFWNDAPITHQDIVFYIIENTQLHLRLHNQQQGKSDGISMRRKHNLTTAQESNVTIFIVAEFGHMCEANSSQLIYATLPQEQVIISDRSENYQCLSTEKAVNQSTISFHGSMADVNRRLSNLIYVPPSDKWGVDTVKFITNKNATEDYIGLFEVVIRPMDDVPLIHINGTREGLERVPSTWETLNITAQEDVPLMLPVFSLSDRDSKSNPFLNSQDQTDGAVEMLIDSMLIVNLKFMANHGQIRVKAKHKDVSLRFNDSGTYLSGQLKRINEVLSIGIFYQGNPNFHGSDKIIVKSENQDLEAEKKDAKHLYFFRELNVNVTQVNDAPYILMPPISHGVLFAAEDMPGFIGSTCKNGNSGGFFVISCRGIEVHDPDDDPLSVTISVKNGRLSFSQSPQMKTSFGNIMKIGTLDQPNRLLTLQGTAREINELLFGMIFQADRNFNSQLGALATLTVSAKDLEGSPASGRLAIHVVPVNDPPILQTSYDVFDSRFRAPDELSFKRVGCRTLETEEDKLTLVSGVYVRDVDSEMSGEPLEIEILTSNGGLLMIAADSRIENWIVGSGGVFTARLRFQSPISELNEALQTLHYQSSLNFNGLDVITLRVSDLIDSQESDCVVSHSTLNESEGHEDVLEIPVKVIGVADAPDMVIPDLLELREDTEASFINKFSVRHYDGNSSIVKIKLQCEHCTLVLNSVDNMNNLWNFTSGHRGGMKHYYIEGTGSVTDWNFLLKNLTYIPSSNWNTHGWSLDELTFILTNVDLAFPMMTLESKTFTTLIDIKPVNDAPIWTVPGMHLKPQNSGGYIVSSVDTLHVHEDEELVIESVSILDEDMTLDRWMTCDTLHVTLKVSSGTIELTTIAGLWIQHNHSKSVIEWKGKLEHSNAALSKIYYRGNSNFYGNDRLQMHVSDQGCEGEGAIMTSSIIIPIAVQSVNDNPYWTVPLDPILCRRNELFCAINGVKVKDSDGDNSTIYGSINVGHGLISFSEAELPPLVEFTGGNWLFRDNEFHFHGRLTQVNTLLSRMRYHYQEVESANGSEARTVLIRLVVSNTEAGRKETIHDSSSSKVNYILLQMVE